MICIIYIQTDILISLIRDMQKFSTKWLIIIAGVMWFFGVLLHTQAQQTAEWELKLEITAGNSCCVYGTSVVFGEKDVSFGITEFTGDFLSYHGTTSWGCKDLLGTETGRAMYISMSGDMENANGNKISSWNVKISYDDTQLVGWNCLLYNNSWVDVPLNSSVTLVEKDGNISTNYGKICELGTTNVQLKVVTNTGQAPGNYVGTLVIDLPSFANASCDELIGTFYDAETDGLNYEWDQWSMWITSNGGQFSYKPWEQITFKVWTVTLGNPVIPAANGSVFVTDLFALARTEITDANVIKVAKLLQGLDDDNNPDNGITISWAIATAFTENNNITALDVDTKLTALSKPIIPWKYIVEHLEKTAETKLEEEIDVTYSWMAIGGWIQDDWGQSIIVDWLWNVHLVWSFLWTATFGSKTLVSSWWYDVLVGEINSSGARINATKWWWRADDYIASMWWMGWMDIDWSWNRYVVWTFHQNIFGDTTFWTTTLSWDFSYNGFIAKLDSNENWVRAKKYGNDDTYDISKWIAVDWEWNSYIVWTFTADLSFWWMRLSHNWLEGQITSDIFIVKIDSEWNTVWVKKWWWIYNDNVLDIKLDWLGNIYIRWEYYNTWSYWNTILTGNWDSNSFIAKMDSDWNWIWAKKWWWTFYDELQWGIDIDWLWNIYITSIFDWTATLWTTTLVSSWWYDVLVAKMNAAWNWIWAKKWWGLGLDVSNWIAVDWSGNSYIIWWFEWLWDFWSVGLESRMECEEWCSPEWFIAKIDSNWNWLSAYVMEGFGMSDITVDTTGYIYVLWSFWRPLVLWFDLYEPVDMYQSDLMIYKIAPRDISEPLRYERIPTWWWPSQS
jgi:hypothetical protein